MIRKALTLTFAIFFVMSHQLRCDDTPFNFIRLNSGARASSLAGAFVSVTGDPSAVFYNPASIYTVDTKNISLTFLKNVLDINAGQLAYVYPEKIAKLWDGRLAGSVNYTNFGTFDYADKSGKKGGTFGANNLAMAVTFSNDLDSNWYYGVSAKFIYVGYEKNSATALAIDAGMLYKLKDNRSVIGLSILNAGTQLSALDGESESLPLDVRLGINHRLRGLPLLLNFSLNHLADRTSSFGDRFTNFSLGGELYLGKYIQLRLGYDNQTRRETSPLTDKQFSGFSGGLGLVTNNYNIDYSLAQMGTAAILHRFSFGMHL